MRALAFLLALTAALPASAATYSLTDSAGDVQCILYDGSSAYAPPTGWTLSPTPVPNCAPVSVAAVSGPTTISGAAFWARFTSAEQAAVASAAQSNASVMAWLITALAAQSIDLTNPATAQGLAIIGPSPGAAILTQAQITNILNPNFTTPQ